MESILGKIIEKFDEADQAIVIEMCKDISGMANMLDEPEGVIAHILLEEIGQERLDSVTTKSELGILVAQYILTDAGVEKVRKALEFKDAMFGVTPKADFHLLTRFDEALIEVLGQAKDCQPVYVVAGNDTVN